MQNSLKYAKILEDAGLPRNVAETHIQILTEVVGDEMATKNDLSEVKSELKNDIARAKADLRSEIADLRAELNALNQRITYEIQGLEHRMTLKLGGLMAAFLATGLTAAKLLFI